jgi:hypothetical protein
VSRTRDPVAGRLAFPAIPHGLRAVAGPRPPGSFRHARRPPPKLWTDGLHDLCLFFRALAKALEPPLVGSSSHGIRVSPSRRHTSCASTPGSRGSLRTDAAKRRFAFRPRGFAPPQRFAPRWSYGSVAPRNRPRVRRVLRLPPCHDARRRRGSTGCPPRDAVHTLRRFPLASSRTASLRPLPSCRYRPARRGRPAEAGCPCRPPLAEASGVQPRSLPAGRRLALPRGVGGRFPCEMGVPTSSPESPPLRGAPVALGGTRPAGLRRALRALSR